MGVTIDGSDVIIPGKATINEAVISSLRVAATTFAGLAWTPAEKSAVSVNGSAFAFPLAVVRLTFPTSAITALDVHSKSLTTLDVSELTALVTLDASGNALTQDAVNAILVALDNLAQTGGTVDLSGGTSPAPNGVGATAATSLTGKGWTVTTN